MGFAAGAILALALLGLRGTAPRPGHYSDWQRDEFVRGLQRNLVMNATVDENDINRLYDSGDLREIVRTCGQMEADGPFSGEDFEKQAEMLRNEIVRHAKMNKTRNIYILILESFDALRKKSGRPTTTAPIGRGEDDVAVNVTVSDNATATVPGTEIETTTVPVPVTVSVSVSESESSTSPPTPTSSILKHKDVLAPVEDKTTIGPVAPNASEPPPQPYEYDNFNYDDAPSWSHPNYLLVGTVPTVCVLSLLLTLFLWLLRPRGFFCRKRCEQEEIPCEMREMLRKLCYQRKHTY